MDLIMVSLPEMVDLTNNHNCCCISLMSTALKIICVILIALVNTSAEAASCFSTSQAGFHQLEEHVTQAACWCEALTTW